MSKAPRGRREAGTRLRRRSAARRSIALALAVAGITACVFLRALGNGFVDLDDQSNFVDNPMFRGFSGANLRWMLTTFHLGPWQPLSWLSLAVDHALWGLDPVGFHLTSVALHAANAALLFRLARRLLARAGLRDEAADAGAVVGALAWAIHPLRVESVAWATERRDVLSCFFLLLALLAYTWPPERPGRLPTALAAAGLGLLAKASVMVLPVFLVVLDVYPLRRLGGAVGWTTPAARRVWREKLWFLALAVPVAALAVVGQREGEALRSLAQVPLAARFGAAMYGLGFYAWKTVAPIDLRPMYEYPATLGPTHPLALAGLATVVAAIAAAVATSRRCPGVGAAMAIYVAALAPVLGLVQTGPQVVAERYSYLAALGWSVLAGGLLVAGTARLTPRLMAAVPPLVVLAALTVAQIGVWRDGLTLWTHTASVDEGNAFAQLRLADYDRRAGDLDKAIERVRASLRLSPYFGEARYELGTLLAARGDLDEARAQYDLALGLAPASAERLSNLGLLLAWSGRPAEAVERFRAALRLRPHLPGVHENLAYALAATGDLQQAAAELEEAIRLDPSAPGPRRALETLRGGTPP